MEIHSCISHMHQDWETIQWRKSIPKSAAEARRRGIATQVVRRRGSAGAEARKVDGTEIGDIKTWGKKRGCALARARAAKGFTQASLAARLHVKVSDIQACENGKAKYEPSLMSKMRRILGGFDKAAKA